MSVNICLCNYDLHSIDDIVYTSESQTLKVRFKGKLKHLGEMKFVGMGDFEVGVVLRKWYLYVHFLRCNHGD